jgi:phosphoribosylglycinamide formyltransferase/phosphoribosylglycinamide formyltransferase-1
VTLPRSRVAVLASGGGSNLQALIDHGRTLGERRASDIVLVASNRPDAGALAKARISGIATAMIDSRLPFEGQDLLALLEKHRIELVVLAGYLQFVPATVTRRFVGRLVNVHPAPLPAFGGPGMYGARVHRAVLASGARMSGPTVHFVDDQYDHGATIAHWPVPVLKGDDERALAARVLRAEHLVYPRVVQAVAAGEIALREDGHVAPPFFREPISAFKPELDDASLASILDRSR